MEYNEDDDLKKKAKEWAELINCGKEGHFGHITTIC